MSKPRTCPSVTGEARHDPRIIGLIQKDGTVANIPTPIPLTDAMRERLGPQPERHFRLAGACREGACSNWRDEACGLIGRMRGLLDATVPPRRTGDPLPGCGIRATCRWWVQEGPEACRVCAHVVYNPSS